ncbi:MAG: ATP-dependent helicase, partial [Methanobrevibacter sp.]|nr:ATP-dependent helicase [Methanobrevibacter sp.]
IDEFQDTDHYQKEIFDKLLNISKTFTIVGDVDQSIYGWRGAYPDNFENYASRDDFKVITLHNNYRSSRNIVEFNEELIKGERNNPKELWAKKRYKAPVYQMVNATVEEEASRIVDLIANLKSDGKIKYYSDVAVLFRTNKSVDKLIRPLEENDIGYYLKENNDFLDQNEVRAMLTLFWYVMPYRKYHLNHLGDDFLNLYGFTDEKYHSNEIFRLSEDTMDILNSIQLDFEDVVKKTARRINSEHNNGRQIAFEYGDVFNLEDDIKEEIFDEVNTFDIADLDREGLIDLGIRDDYDLEFFLKLRDIKIRLLGDSRRSLTTLRLFYELLNVTEYFSEISIENNPNQVKIKENLALFSHIIKDYESIMGEYDYEGLFTYLSRVLKGYSCRHDEADEGFNKVHLLSMHSAKGLEYPVVIVGSIKQGICPLDYKKDKKYSNPNVNLEYVERENYRSDELYPTPNRFLEYKENDLKKDEAIYDAEELRTIYVATTRAKEILVLSTIGESPEDVPEFLYNLRHNPNTNIQLLHPYTLTNIPKIESSKVFKQKNDFPNIYFENLLDDYLYCDYRYDLANNTRFKVKLRNDKYVNMVLHKLLDKVHSDENISLGRIDAKINEILEYHNIKEFNNAYEIINNVRDYWMEYGRKYDIMESNNKLFNQYQYCDLYSVIDLVIKEDDKISLVHFIGSDENIPDIDEYMSCLLYYFNLLKELDEFSDYEFNKVYLHSLKNNKRYEQIYDEELEEDVVDFIEDAMRVIHNKEFVRNTDNCETC